MIGKEVIEMTLQEFNFIHDAFIDRGNLDGAFLLEELYPELLERSIGVFFEEIDKKKTAEEIEEEIDAAYQRFRKFVLDRMGKEGLRKLDSV